MIDFTPDTLAFNNRLAKEAAAMFEEPTAPKSDVAPRSHLYSYTDTKWAEFCRQQDQFYRWVDDERQRIANLPVTVPFRAENAKIHPYPASNPADTIR